LKIVFIQHGKTTDAHVEALEQLYYQRLKHYIPFELKVLPDLKRTKSLSEDQLKKLECEQLMAQLEPGDWLVLLDEKGKEMDSVGFAHALQKRMNQGLKRLVFVVGGAYGFSAEAYGRANEKIALSRMTFSHQIIRCIFAEQLYRAFTILNNEPYHHA
jgi:23S rRNA (pseudouridine1915-N3)-methyltransferase